MRPTFLASILIAQLTLAPVISAQNARPAAKPAAEKPAPDKPASLPVTRVSLYKNGVGFFEHTGHITGNADVSIDFTTAQLNDVLQSLTAIDLNGGRISGAGYNSTTPLEQQLKSLPLALGEDTTAAGFYAAIRGARVEVHAGSVSITGRLLSVEERAASVAPPSADDAAAAPSRPPRQYLTVVSDAGEVRTVELNPLTSVRLLENGLNADVTRYLKLLADNRSQGLRHLILTDRGSGARELRVSYISEVPVWKSTYRILFTDRPGANAPQTATLQGWAVVDNTVGEDWNNVQLSLIAGAPQSFTQPLSDPIYSHRPEIPIAQEAQLMPQTFLSGLGGGNGFTNGISGTVKDPSGAMIPNATVAITNSATGARFNISTDSAGHFSAQVPPGRYNLDVSSPGFEQSRITNAMPGSAMDVTLPVGSVSQSVMVSSEQVASLPVNGRMTAKLSRGFVSGTGYGAGIASPAMAAPLPPDAYQSYAYNSIAPTTSTSAFDDFFEYKLSEPITIHKNESALVPILQDKVRADRVTVATYGNGSLSQPLRAVWLTNSTGLTLDRGSFSIVENGNFGGEGLLDAIHDKERRLLSYAADQAVHVSTEGDSSTNQITLLQGSKGVLNIHRAEVHKLTFVIHNAATDHRTVVTEVPVVGGWELDKNGAKPEETTATAYRFRTEVEPGETVRLHVDAKHDGSNTYYLTNTDDNTVQFFLNETHHNPALIGALQPILDARHKVADAQAAVYQTEKQLEVLRKDEERQRANITALNSADKGSRDRFVNDLNATEDKIKSTTEELVKRNATLDAAKDELSKRIEAFSIDEKL